MGTILQVFQADSGQWGGRLLRDGVEGGRIAGCISPAEVEAHAYEGGVDIDRVERLDQVPPVE